MILTSQGPLIARDRPRRMHEVVCPINMNTMRGAVIHPKTERVEQDFKLHSYVEGFINWVYRCMTNASTPQMYDILGSTTSPFGTSLSILRAIESTDTNRRGILFGSSTDAEDITLRGLPGRFTANVSYSPATLHHYTNSATDKYFDLLRTITSTTDDLDINELGWAGWSTGSIAPVLWTRDVLPATVTLNTDEARIFRIRCSFDLTTLRPFMGFFYSGVSNTTVSLPRYDGTSTTVSTYLYCNAGDDVITKGTRISSSDTAVAWDDYTMPDMFPVTDFYHYAQSFSAPVISHPNGSFTTWRDFINISGSPQTVRKYGLWIAPGANYFLAHAALLPAPVVVGADEGIRITYKFSIEH